MNTFFVQGKPVPQGSMKFIRPGVMIHSRAEDLALWRADIARNAKQNGYEPKENACRVTLDFVFNKPKTVKRQLFSVRPDLDKLTRAVFDGLTGTAFLDDCQVISLNASKRYGEQAGVWIGVIYYENA